MGLTLRHPDIGDMIGDYKIVGFLGAGGLGIVYKVERGGLFFALKLLLVSTLDGRGKREIGILIHLENPGVVRYVGSDFWPDPVIGHPYIVMEFVPGDTLFAFAYSQNPSARKATRIVLEVAVTLGEVHAAGVFHRDVKPENILIREGSERPILIDFGIGSLASAPTVTGSQLPPGTEEFRSPEQIRFQRANPDGTGQYEYGPTDEMWALGVAYYWLLTDELPFGERTDPGGLDGLRERILTQRPEAPHVLNPRVPLAASLLCMKMLAERPEDRFPVLAMLCAALNESLSTAESDATWDPPLGDPDDPQLTTTVEDPERQEGSEQRRAFLRLRKQRPRRGRPLPKRDRVFLLPEQMAAPRVPPAAVNPDELPRMNAPGVAAPAGGHKPPVPSALVPPASELEPAAAPQPRRAAWRLGLAGAVLLVAVVVLFVGANLGGPGSSIRTSEARPELPLPSTSPGPHATDAGVRGREVASDAKALESLPGGDAASVGAQLPASTANAMLRTSAQTPKNETPKTQTQGAGFRLPVKPAAVAVCALLDGGCTAPASQVRTEPPAISCPHDWRKTHERFNVTGRDETATVKGYKGEPREVFKVKDGPVTLQVGIVGSVGRLPNGTLLLGQWQLGDNRLFGTFTEAKIPGEGTLPVCLVAGLEGVTVYVDEHGKNFDCSPGLGVCLDPGSTPGNAKTPTRVFLIQPSGQP
ncbi:serine/threonine protein kinase [Archangium lansingense]|uniref:Protein kinase n=1 Tax=Archangium lansingense TaxID=2995310 RepID=A0ABT4AA48_9BACT|nr:serine/threonine protein kinase [Archangium lansinium]MCY1078538.1 protein kinase [Archangium lansinium]